MGSWDLNLGFLVPEQLLVAFSLFFSNRDCLMLEATVDLVEVKLEGTESLEYRTVRFERFSSFNEEPLELS